MDSKHIIMRRVYYSFSLSLLTSAALWQGVVLGASIAAFGRLTHVAAISNNLLATPTGNLPSYIYTSVMKALTGGEVLTVLVVFFMVTLSVMWTKRINETLLQSKVA